MTLKLTLDFDTEDGTSVPKSVTIGQLLEFADAARANGLAEEAVLAVKTWNGDGNWEIPTAFEIEIATTNFPRPRVIDATSAFKFVGVIDQILADDGDARTGLTELALLREQLLQ